MWAALRDGNRQFKAVISTIVVLVSDRARIWRTVASPPRVAFRCTEFRYVPPAVVSQRRIEEVRRESRGGRDASTAGGPLLRKIVSSTNDVAGGKRSDAKSASSRMTMSDREIVDQAKR